MIELTNEAIDTQRVLSQVQSGATGAVTLFLGTTREFTDGRQTAMLDYDCYPEMARTQLEQLEQEARSRWPIHHCAIVHRLGRVELGEASVAVAVSTPHRRAAFEAAQWLIDQLKLTVPIWKREAFADGTSEWVHPGVPGNVGTAENGEA